MTGMAQPITWIKNELFPSMVHLYYQIHADCGCSKSPNVAVRPSSVTKTFFTKDFSPVVERAVKKVNQWIRFRKATRPVEGRTNCVRKTLEAWHSPNLPHLVSWAISDRRRKGNYDHAERDISNNSLAQPVTLAFDSRAVTRIECFFVQILKFPKI